MTYMDPLFSIITVTYNAGNTIARTINSVASQSCTLYEHLIMDGASTDGTLGITQELEHDKLRVISAPDHGIYDAMNKGISEARGDYLIFLNAGDKFHSTDTLQLIADAILKNDYPGIVYGQTDIVDDHGNYIGPRHLQAPEELTLKSFRNGMVVCHQAFVVLRRIADFYNLKYKYAADYEWCIICLQHSRSNVYLNVTIIDYLNEGETTRHMRKSLTERFLIMCTYFGVLPTIWRHIGFAFRYLARRRSASNIQ